jgi:hypothetical protein
MRSKAGKRRRLASALDGIAGIGPKTRQLLLRHLGGPDRLRAASDQDLLAVSGVTARHVKALRAHFAREPQGPSAPLAREEADDAALEALEESDERVDAEVEEALDASLEEADGEPEPLAALDGDTGEPATELSVADNDVVGSGSATSN